MAGVNGVHRLEAVAEWSGRVVAWLALAMVAVTFAIVVLRRAGIGWIALQEAVMWMHGTLFMLGLAYTLKHDAHVRVDVFLRRAGPRARAVVDLAGTVLLLLPLCAFIIWSSRGYVVDAWAIGESSREAGGLPGLYLLKTVIPVGALLLALQGFALAARCLSVLGTRN